MVDNIERVGAALVVRGVSRAGVVLVDGGRVVWWR